MQILHLINPSDFDYLGNIYCYELRVTTVNVICTSSQRTRDCTSTISMIVKEAKIDT